jgi:cytosine/adenosine deaminase-related metal-dependent hydrolase
MLITGGHVVTEDPELGDIPGGDVLVRDGRIAAVGTDLRPRAPQARLLDARGRLVLPGLVDTHRHVWQGAIAGFTPQMTGYGYGPAVLTGIAIDHTPADVLVASSSAAYNR